MARRGPTIQKWHSLLRSQSDIGEARLGQIVHHLTNLLESHRFRCADFDAGLRVSRLQSGQFLAELVGGHRFLVQDLNSS